MVSMPFTFGGKEKQLENKCQRVSAHIERLRQSKIDVSEERFRWLHWCQSHCGTVSKPALTILNFSKEDLQIGKIVAHAFEVDEVRQDEEDFEQLRWILECKPTKSATATSKPENRKPVESKAECSEAPEAKLLNGQSLSSVESPNSRNSTGQDVASTKENDGNSRKSPDALLVICGDSLSPLQQLIIGSAFLQGRPVLTLTAGATAEVCEAASQWTAGTWPVFGNQHSLIMYLEHELPYQLQLRQVIHQDIHKLLERHKSVNLTWYALSRGALALVPFGVHALNTASLFDLCRQCMVDAGMHADKQAQDALAKGAGKVGAVEFVGNSASDVYQLLVQGAILTEMVEAGSVAAAMATLDLADVFLLGSISIVTGAVAAFTAYMSRPQLVDSIADVMVMLQFTYCANPELRRRVLDGSIHGEVLDADMLKECHADPILEAGPETIMMKSTPLADNGSPAQESVLDSAGASNRPDSAVESKPKLPSVPQSSI